MGNQTEPFKLSRRGFLGTAGAAGAALVGVSGGINLIELAAAKADGDAVSSSVRWGLLVDTTRCADDCVACVTACNTEHRLDESASTETMARWIRKIELRDNSTGMEHSLPVMCQHCEEPPCVDVCPTGASFTRDDGIVLVDKHICIGCRYCMMACPFGARSFVHEALHNQKPYSPRGKGTVESCTMCVHRVDKDEQPACVEGCHKEGGGALMFGDLKDPASDISKRQKSVASREIRADFKLNTGVRYEGI